MMSKQKLMITGKEREGVEEAARQIEGSINIAFTWGSKFAYLISSNCAAGALAVWTRLVLELAECIGCVVVAMFHVM